MSFRRKPESSHLNQFWTPAFAGVTAWNKESKNAMSTKHKQTDFGFEMKKTDGPVECLGMTFENDATRRKYFTEKLREKLKDQEFRKIEGFPIGEDEDILALSDPPYYTACPNPFLGDFIEIYGKPFDAKDKYHREPFAADVKEGKNDPIYNVHSYHTKVPHKAIMRYILHYTEPGDLVFDGFAGTGMTAAAGVSCDEKYPVLAQGIINKSAKIGKRYVIVSDLSPIASFIAGNLLRPLSDVFLKEIRRICEEINRELGHLYETKHNGWKVRDRKNVVHKWYDHRTEKKGNIEFALYSDVVRCPECSAEEPYYSIAVDELNDKLQKSLKCPSCNAFVKESAWDRVLETKYDPILQKAIRHVRIKPVLINYSIGTKRYEKIPDKHDQEMEKKAEALFQKQGLPSIELITGKETQRNVPIGITHLHHFFTPREHVYVAALLRKILLAKNSDMRNALLFALTATLPYASRLRRFRADRKGGGPLSGTLYVSSLITPPNVTKSFLRNAVTIAESLVPSMDPSRSAAVSTQSATCLTNLPDDSVDYIFTDPPFGHNFDYSELNFFWEGFLGVITNQDHEAIISSSQQKDLNEYKILMDSSLSEYYRILKPGHWITVEFSNTRATVWNAIQTSLQEAGFVVANVAALDKKQGSFKAVTTPTAVKQDLIISAYKPNGGLEQRFIKEAHTEKGIWDFVSSHLKNLPVVKPRGGQLEFIAERDPRILYDRTVAYYVRHGFPVPLSSPEFQAGLADRFPERDGMYFLPEQAAEYDKKRIRMEGLGQLAIWVEDERSAANWLRNFLKDRPSKYQDIQPEFFEQLNQGWKKWETRPELRALLDQYFLCYIGEGNVPPQIHGYLSTNFHDLRNLPADHPTLRSKARDRWYVPDPKKNADVEKLREKRLLDEFWTYLPPGYDVDQAKKGGGRYQQKLPGMDQPLSKTPRGKRLKLVRTEAVRVGFKHCYQNRDYQTIIAAARYIPEDVVNGDDQLQMIYDTAVTRSGSEF